MTGWRQPCADLGAENKQTQRFLCRNGFGIFVCDCGLVSELSVVGEG